MVKPAFVEFSISPNWKDARERWDDQEEAGKVVS
jgi:hypothetical protein